MSMRKSPPPDLGPDLLARYLSVYMQSRQMSDMEKRAQAHYVVITDKGLDHAREQVKMILADVRNKLNA